MSSPEDRSGCEHSLDVAAYVLGALEERELESFREHLATCTSCREEIVQMQPVADSLSIGVARMVAPETLRARIMATVHAEAELLRAAGHEADRPEPARRRWRPQLLPALAATAALAAGLVIGAVALNGGSNSSPATHVIQASVFTPNHNASAQLRKVGSHLELDVADMPAPPQGRIYEVWLEHGNQPPLPTDALFSVTHTGLGSVAVPGDLKGVSKVLVTDEPLGGSLKPTRNPVIVASV